MTSPLIILVTSILAFLMPASNIISNADTRPITESIENKTGEGTTIYVLDTGIELNNPSLEGKVTNYDFQPLDALIGEAQQTECFQHGTAVPSIAHQYAKNANIISVRVMDCDGQGIDPVLSQAIEHIIKDDVKGRKIINLSLNFKGGLLNGFLTEVSVEKAINKGIAVTIAAGNIDEEFNAETNACDRSPSRVEQALTVGSYSTFTDEKTSYTATGKCVDVYAPGNAYVPYAGTRLKAWGNGTSYAAPYAAAMIARLMEDDPKVTVADLNATVKAKSNFQDFIKLQVNS